MSYSATAFSPFCSTRKVIVLLAGFHKMERAEVRHLSVGESQVSWVSVVGCQLVNYNLERKTPGFHQALYYNYFVVL